MHCNHQNIFGKLWNNATSVAENTLLVSNEGRKKKADSQRASLIQNVSNTSSPLQALFAHSLCNGLRLMFTALTSMSGCVLRLSHRCSTVCSIGSWTWPCFPTAPWPNTRRQTTCVVAPPPFCAPCTAVHLLVRQPVDPWSSRTLWQDFQLQVLQTAHSVHPECQAAVCGRVQRCGKKQL